MAKSIAGNAFFNAPPETHSFSGLLLDMDGTIIDSTEAVVRHWHEIGKEIGVDPEVILATSHGRRTIDILKALEPAKATWEYVKEVETIIPIRYGNDAKEIPGSRRMLDSINAFGVPWAIVTSGSRPLVTGWLDVMTLAHPQHLVTAEDVLNGKPDPSCYLLGREKLGLDPDTNLLVLEDAPAGIRSGKAAGFKVIGLATSHTVEQLREAKPDWIVKDMESVSCKGYDKQSGKVHIEISRALE